MGVVLCVVVINLDWKLCTHVPSRPDCYFSFYLRVDRGVWIETKQEHEFRFLVPDRAIIDLEFQVRLADTGQTYWTFAFCTADRPNERFVSFFFM